MSKAVPSHASTPPAARTARADPPPGTTSSQNVVLAVITSCMLLIGVDTTVVNLAVPDMGAALHFGPTGLTWIANSYTLTFGGLLLFGGRLGDVLGRRRLFVAGITVFSVASLLGGFAPWAWWLIAARALQGVGAALAAPSTMALIVANFEGAARARAIALYSAVLGTGAAVGLVLGGVLVEFASWRWVLLVNVPIGAVIACAAHRVLRQPQAVSASGSSVSPVGAVTATAASGLVVYGLVRAAGQGWGDRWAVYALGASAVLLVGFVAGERRARVPLLPHRLLRERGFVFTLGAVGCLCAAMFSVLFLLGRFFQDGLGYSPLRSGFAFLPLVATQFTAARLVPRVTSRVGRLPLALGGALACGTGLLWLGALTAHGAYAQQILGPLVLMGAGAGTWGPTLTAALMSSVTPADSGAASGMLQTSQWLGGSLGLACWTAVFGHASRGASTPLRGLTSGTSAAFTAAVAAAALSLPLILAALRRPPR